MQRTKAKKPTTGAARRHWQWGIVLGLIAGIVAVSVYAIVHHGSLHPFHEVEINRIEVTPEPPNGRTAFLGEVRQLGGYAETVSLSDPAALGRLQQVLAQHPLVKSVERVETPGADRLSVVLRYRTAVAVVRVGRERYGIDEDGVCLPGPGGTPAGVLEIQGAEAPPRGKPGERWGTPVIEAAARLARLIAPDRERLGISAIEVDENPVQAELRLRTAGGSRVLWECSPESSREPTLSAEEKLQRLRAYVEAEGSLDAPTPTGPYLHDVRFASKHTRKGLPKK
jgi:hypothetical protein